MNMGTGRRMTEIHMDNSTAPIQLLKLQSKVIA
jgi:hypothetical protein